MSNATNTATLSTVERAFEIVRTLREMDGARITELSEHMGLASSTVHKHLTTLKRHGFVTKEGDEYHVGLRFLDYGYYARSRTQEYRICTEKVADIAAETGERAQFVAEESGWGVYLHTVASESGAVRTNRRTGSYRYLHASAAGKAILAHLPERQVDRILDRRGLPEETPHTITDREELKAALSEVYDRGVAFNDEESVMGLRAVGVPVCAMNGLVVGAFSVSGPSHRLKGDLYREDISDTLLGHANEVELNIRYD